MIFCDDVAEGEVQAELVDPDGKVVEGFSKDDYLSWHGDNTSVPVRWTGGNACPHVLH